MKLIAKTKHGKDILSRWPANHEFFIYREVDRVFFSSEAGPWLLILPENSISDEVWRHARWVHKYNDADFKLETL